MAAFVLASNHSFISISAAPWTGSILTATQTTSTVSTGTVVAATAVSTPDKTKEQVNCFNCGQSGYRLELRRAMKFFCKGGVDGRFGDILGDDKTLYGGKSLGLAYMASDYLLVRVIVRLNDDCQLNFNTLGYDDCNIVYLRLLDECNTESTQGKQGGYMTDNCARWTLDPQNYHTDEKVCAQDPNAIDPPDSRCWGWTDERNFFGDDGCEGRSDGWQSGNKTLWLSGHE